MAETRDMPLVSVCVPAYNNADTIRATVESVLASDYRPIEVIVVDDCSTDDTYEVISGIEHPALYIYKNEKNLGMAGNWNRCLSLCKGKYVRLLCADDRIDQPGGLDHGKRVLCRYDIL